MTIVTNPSIYNTQLAATNYLNTKLPDAVTDNGSSQHHPELHARRLAQRCVQRLWNGRRRQRLLLLHASGRTSVQCD